MKKFLVPIIGIVFFLSMVLSGCSSSSSSDASSSGSSKGVTTIAVWNRWPELNETFKTTIADFEKDNPNIHVKLTNVPSAQYTAQLQAAIQGNQLPDIFGYTPSLSLSQLTQLGVIRNIDDVITNKKKDQFVQGTWAEGYTTLKNKVYQFPLMIGYHYTNMMFYNKDILKKYGITQIPKTWGQFIKDGEQIYQKSNGKTYGLIVGGNASTNFETNGEIMAMAASISPDVFWNSGGVTGIDYKTGKYDFDTSGIVDTMNFFKEMKDKNVLHPNSMQSDDMQSKGLFENGVAAFTFDGTMAAGVFNSDGFKDWGVAAMPTKDGNPYYEGFQGESPAGLLVSENTKHYKEVKLFLDYMFEHFYKNLAKNGVEEPPVKSAMQGITLPYPQFKDVADLQNKIKILAPNPYNKNLATVDVIANAQSNEPTDSLGTVLQGYLSGQISDIQSALKQRTDKYNKALSDAIKQSNGKVSQSDFQFPDWTPFQPYNH
ncbi:extracellular solute-binding protein [Pullulanibacillus sp. KACC 23026]|uniref:ABC transporter substrate-binding protein n=1 Tax=Pullulanibacillus sp. KACC 23026 TaxID=3028315 RepID=UPI0023AFED2C|nr:extracellular solute-binding protein [Pullulanibacillus sp. KACC 23026]WEG11204.1 extracellular solute-binding protein [Pullulanibacillus sp. KACC 23026]